LAVRRRKRTPFRRRRPFTLKGETNRGFGLPAGFGHRAIPKHGPHEDDGRVQAVHLPASIRHQDGDLARSGTGQRRWRSSSVRVRGKLGVKAKVAIPTSQTAKGRAGWPLSCKKDGGRNDGPCSDSRETSASGAGPARAGAACPEGSGSRSGRKVSPRRPTTGVRMANSHVVAVTSRNRPRTNKNLFRGHRQGGHYASP